MVSFAQVLVPIFAAAILVFLASSIIHMLLKYHQPEHRKLPNEDAVRAIVRAGGAGPGQYILPHCADPKEMQGEAMKQKLVDGPVGVMTLRPAGPISMGPLLGGWFVLNLAVAAIAGFLACSVLPKGAPFGTVCQLVGGISFLAYGTGSVANAIWWGKPRSAMAKELLDALIYGVVSGIAFGWLWPR